MASQSEICKSAAYLVAALHAEGVMGRLPRESKDAATILLDELKVAGHMDPYDNGEGGYEVK